jgi:hypothetical protein
MTVIVIDEENHGLLGVAKDYKAAIKYLCQTNWLTKDTEMNQYDEEKGWEYIPISKILGENVIETLSLWTITEFNDFFEGMFALWEEEVWEE